tara:strand:+ start:28 stop:897 length:870 start_codon:yes stop_codon:yes gene_type:complete
MADKKITALTDMAATGKSPAEDLLHIIDYGGGSSPVNKKITIANLFSKVNTSTQIYAASSEFEIGLTDSTVSVLKASVGASATAASGVVINDNQNALTDFTVKTENSAQAIFVDSSDDSGAGNVNYVKINGDSAKIDFQVNSDTGILVHTDSNDHSVGIGTAAPSANYMLDVIADASTGHSVHTAGNILMSGTQAISNASTAIDLTKPVTTIAGIAGSLTHTMAAGTEGQIKVITCLSRTSGESTITVTNSAWGGNNRVVLDAAGEGVTLIYAGSKWNLMGGKGNSTIS